MEQETCFYIVIRNGGTFALSVTDLIERLENNSFGADPKDIEMANLLRKTAAPSRQALHESEFSEEFRIRVEKWFNVILLAGGFKITDGNSEGRKLIQRHYQYRLVQSDGSFRALRGGCKFTLSDSDESLFGEEFFVA
jgi:hypothetical protein